LGGHILYFLCAPVYGNLIYSAYRRYDRPEQTVIRVREGDDAAPTRATTTVGNAGEGGVGEEV
jgi:hypothetical protein